MTTTDEAEDSAILARNLGSRPESADGLLEYEDPVVAALSHQADDVSAVVPVAVLRFPRIKVPAVERDSHGRWVVVIRDGKPVIEEFHFRIRALQRAERLNCERQSRDQAPNRSRLRQGMPQEVDVNEAELRMLYQATVREDRERFWDSAALRARHRVGEGWEVIGKMLTDPEQISAILALYDLGSEAQVEQRHILSGL